MTQEEANKKNQECIDNFRRFSLNLDSEVKIALEQAALIVETDAKLTHPWNNDTGHLQASITHRLISQSAGRVNAEVGTNVVYGKYLEFGTEKMRARPWLFPALNRNKSKIDLIIKKSVKKAVDDAGRKTKG
jgi:HK97 gp10 family phage protein